MVRFIGIYNIYDICIKVFEFFLNAYSLPFFLNQLKTDLNEMIKANYLE